MLTLLLAAALALGAAHDCFAQSPATQPSQPASSESRPIGSIDFYGLRRVEAEALRPSLRIREGDPLSREAAGAFRKSPETLLTPIPQITPLGVSYVCCDERGSIAVFIGVRESGHSQLQFRPAPKRALSLPADLVRADAEVQQAVIKAVMSGRAQEDDSQGHALLINDPTARALQEQLVTHAKRHLRILREVLRESADGEQRAIAARTLGYAVDKQAVVADLVHAMTDPHEGVRNDAMRALGVFTRAKENPPRVPYEPFIALLESPVWTDLNKASMALAELTATRDPALLKLLRARALPSLVEMARWRSRGHAQAALLILGRIGGYSDEDLLARWARNNTEQVVRDAYSGVRSPQDN
jgi:hypothetical protein